MSWLDEVRRHYGSDEQGLVYAVADKLYVANNRSKGAFYQGGFGFLAEASQEPWKRRARNLLARPSAIHDASPSNPQCPDQDCPVAGRVG